MNDKLLNMVLTFFGVGLIIYGISTMLNNDDKKPKEDKKETKEETKVKKFNAEEKYKYIQNYYYDLNVNDVTFDDDLYLSYGVINIEKFSDCNYEEVVDGFEYTGNCFEKTILANKIKDIFGNQKVEYKDFSYALNYYKYDLDTDSYYVYVLPAAGIEMEGEISYSFTDSTITKTLTRDDLLVKDYIYSYTYDKKLNDYYLTGIEIKER